MNDERKTELVKLVKDFLTSLEDDKNKDSVKKTLSGVTSDRIFFYLSLQKNKELYNIIKNLLNEDVISSNHSESYIKKLIADAYRKWLFNESDVNDLSSSLINNLISGKESEYNIFSEIDILHVPPDRPTRLIDCEIELLEDGGANPDEGDVKILIQGGSGMGKNYIYTKVKAGDFDKAKELASHEFIVSFSLLTVYYPIIKPFLKGDLFKGERKAHNKVDKSQYNNIIDPVYSSLLKGGIEELGKTQIEDSVKDGCNKEKRSKKKNNPIKKVIKSCLYWFGSGLDEKNPSARLVKFVAALEAPLKKENEYQEVTKTISERGAFLLREGYEQRKKAIKELREIYDNRSKVVHEAALINKQPLSNLAGDYVREILMKLIKMNKQLKLNGNFEAFIDHIDDIKLGKYCQIEGGKDNKIC